MIKSPENTVNVAVTKLLFLGPSLQGKTVTRKRLTKMIRNLSSDPSDDKSNTGICEQSTVITCKNLYRGVILAEEEGEDWKVVEDIEQEVETFINTQSIPKDKFDSSVKSPQQYIPNETLNTKENPEQKSLDSSVEEISSSSPSSVHPETETHEKTHVNVPSSELSVEDIQISPENISQCLQMKKAYSLSEIKLHLNNGCMIYLQDTGGQPELMDCLPALTIGPALYLLFCKLNTNLDDHYTVGYRGTDGKTSSLLSHFTIKETLLSALVSISSMLYSSSDDCADIKQQFENRQHCVYIIGTHRDKVKDDSSIDAFETNLKEVIDSTFFYKKGLIKEWYQDDFPANSTLRDSSMRLVYPLDNQNGGSDEIQCLRRALSQKIHEYAIKIPIQWLILGIVLRGRPEVMLTVETCFTIGRHLNMNKSQTEAALHFIHYNLGICMHFSNVKELKDVVITDTQEIYQSLTKIIEAAFKPGIVHEVAASELKNTGQFSFESFSRKVKTPLPLEVLVIVLEHLNIIAPIPSANKEETKFFMPCILPNASDTEIMRYEEEYKIPHEVSPLYIRYDCGFVPMGVFSATVAKLIQQSSKIVSLRI